MSYGTALHAIRELRGNLELLGRVTKELEAAPTVNLHLNPQWIELRTTLLFALEPHPHAKEAVLAAITNGGSGAPDGS
jgi:hypothetical protein